MKKLILSILFVLSFSVLKSEDKTHYSHMKINPVNNSEISKDTSEINLSKFKEGIDFYAMGNEPFWNLDIAKNQFVKFNSLNGDSVKLGSVQSEKAMDANIVRYYSKTEKGSFTATIYDEKCMDNMSGVEFKYKVVVEINNFGDPDYKKFTGCGRYVPDYNLNKKWVLQSIGDSPADSANYMTGLPEISFDVESLKFSGSAGCNRIFGSLYCEDGNIRFNNTASTMMMCPDMDKEKEFLEVLGNTTKYKVTGNQLILSNPDKTFLVFYDPELRSLERSGTDGNNANNLNRLYDIWALESMNGIPIDPKNYMKEIPRLELNTKDMTFFGNSGCNNMNGKIEADNSLIKFSEIASTRMMCPGNYEADFMNALKSVTGWKVENMKLYLSSNGTDVLVLKKID